MKKRKLVAGRVAGNGKIEIVHDVTTRAEWRRALKALQLVYWVDKSVKVGMKVAIQETSTASFVELQRLLAGT